MIPQEICVVKFVPDLPKPAAGFWNDDEMQQTVFKKNGWEPVKLPSRRNSEIRHRGL
jgi:hypothetical protein